MNKPTKRFLRCIRKNLACSRVIRRRLMKPFLRTLELYLEEKPEPYEEDLLDAFGPPEELAEFMMESVTPGQRTRYRVGRWAVRIIAAALVVAFIVISMLVLQYKLDGFEITDEVFDPNATSTTEAIE